MGASSYYGMLEKAALDIVEQKELKPKYYITLYWGFDGLQEDDDGIWKWVSRRKKETDAVHGWEPQPIYSCVYDCCQSSADMRNQLLSAQMQNASVADMRNQLLSAQMQNASVADMRNQLLYAQIQNAVMQNAVMQNAVMKNTVQSMLSRQISQCCVR